MVPIRALRSTREQAVYPHRRFGCRGAFLACARGANYALANPCDIIARDPHGYIRNSRPLCRASRVDAYPEQGCG